MSSSATLADRNIASAKAYYQAMKKHDLNDMSRYLSEEIYLVTPMEELNGKQRVLEAAEKLLPHVMDLEIKSSFASGEQVALIYDLDFSPPLGICRTAAVLTFKDGLIIRNELFFDARPFDQSRTAANTSR